MLANLKLVQIMSTWGEGVPYNSSAEIPSKIPYHTPTIPHVKQVAIFRSDKGNVLLLE